MKYLLLFFLLVVAGCLEGYTTTIPFLLAVLLVASVGEKKPFVFFFAFLAGIFFDSITLTWIGKTSSLFLLFLLFVSLYEKKFETQTHTFVFVATYISCSLFLLFEGIHGFLPQALIAAFFATGLFFVVYGHNRKRSSYDTAGAFIS